MPRTGSARPPARDRLRLYGLYKQSMEGDVAGVMARPASPSPAATVPSAPPPHNASSSPPPPTAADIDEDDTGAADRRTERDKWDAWAACAGLSRTQAKRAYVERLLATMRRHATATPAARALVEELEAMWAQARQGLDSAHRFDDEDDEDDEAGAAPGAEAGLRVLRPMSEDNDEGPPERGTRGIPPRGWRERTETGLVQIRAELAALRETLAVDGGATGRRRGGSGAAGRGSGRGPGTTVGAWARWAARLVWRLALRAAVDVAAVLALALVVRWWQRAAPRGGLAAGETPWLVRALGARRAEADADVER